MRAWLQLISVTLVTVSFNTFDIQGATFSAELSLAPKAGVYGEYLSAAFDFGGGFTEIHSVSLNIELSTAFRGYAMATGNSFYSQTLFIQLHDETSPPPAYDYHTMLSRHTSKLSPGAANTEFRAPLVYTGKDSYEERWPAMLFAGRGVVSLIDEYMASTRVWSGEQVSNTTRIWQAPAGIESAQLIVEATRVPEPASIASMVILCAQLLIATRPRLA